MKSAKEYGALVERVRALAREAKAKAARLRRPMLAPGAAAPDRVDVWLGLVEFENVCNRVLADGARAAAVLRREAAPARARR